MVNSMELRETFRAPFLQTAWQRHERVVDLLGGDELGSELRSAASELHCLSGEASMLDFAKVADVARYAEKAAREGDRARLNQLMTELYAAIKAVEAEGSP